MDGLRFGAERIEPQCEQEPPVEGSLARAAYTGSGRSGGFYPRIPVRGLARRSERRLFTALDRPLAQPLSQSWPNDGEFEALAS
jgi:hypothetical protein